MSQQPVLLDLGAAAYAHQNEVNEVKQQLGVRHPNFDCWIYGFLENKNFKVGETVAKLQRRDEFEKKELGTYEMTDWMMESMRKGTIQVIGEDKEGRVTFYITTSRDRPTSAKRDESRKNFDMWLSYGTRLRKENKRCQITMLINQDKASMWSNLDMTFQADVALRIAKFYPGCVGKMYICKMNRTLAAMAKPIFSRLPTIVSERIQIISDGDIKGGKLLTLFDESVLPIALGGQNDCDKQEYWDEFAMSIKNHFDQLKLAINSGLSVKEWELERLRAEGGVTETKSSVDALRQAVLSPPNSKLDSSHSDLNMSGELPRMKGRGGSNASLRRIPLSMPPMPGFDQGRSQSQSSRQSDSCVNIGDALGKKPGLHAEDDEWYSCDVYSADLAGISLNEDRHQQMFHVPSLTQMNATRSSNNPSGNVTFNTVVLSERREIFMYYLEQFNFLESFFRVNIVEMHEREWLAILQRELQEQTAREDKLNNIDGEELAKAFPGPLQFVVRGCIWLLLVVMTVYFFLGTLFVGILGSSIMIDLFFSMFLQPYFIFPYGSALIVTGYQFTLFCTRGIELTKNTFNGKLVDGFRALGPRVLLLQGILYLGGVLAFFVIFCVFATRDDPLTGLQYSLSVGWIFAACVTILYHFFYGFGIRQISKAKSRDKNRSDHAETTVYLFLNVAMEDHELKHSATTEFLLLSVPMLLGFVFGLCNMLNPKIYFLCATVVCTFVVQLMASVFIVASTPASNSALMVASVTYGCVFWLYTTFALSAHSWGDSWGSSVLTALFLMLLTNAMSFGCMYRSLNGVTRRWLFRLAWFVLIANLTGSLVSMFVINFRIGLYVLVLAAHLILYNFRACDSVSIYGIGLMTGGFLAVLLACVILGDYNWTATTSSSPPSVIANPSAPSTNFSASTIKESMIAPLYEGSGSVGLNHLMASPLSRLTSVAAAAANEYLTSIRSVLPSPLCSMEFPLGLDIVDMAVFAKLPYATSDESRVEELGRHFPDFQYAGQLPLSAGSFVEGHMFVYRATLDNISDATISLSPVGGEESQSLTSLTTGSISSTFGTTSVPDSGLVIVAFREKGNLLASMSAMTMWIHALSMSFMGLVMPYSWLPRSLQYISFMNTLAPVQWRATLDEVRTQLQSLKQNSQEGNGLIEALPDEFRRIFLSITLSDMYVVGSGPSGALAAVAAAHLHLPSVLFSSPSVLQSCFVFGLDEETVIDNVLSIVPQNNLFLTGIIRNPGIQIVPCNAPAGECDKIEHMISTLTGICREGSSINNHGSGTLAKE